MLPGFYHDTLGERDRAQALAPLRAFVLREFDAPSARVARRRRPARRVPRRIRGARPAARECVRAGVLGATRAGLKAGGALSDGIALGCGSASIQPTLDYVYRNRAQGRLGVGALIDHTYLDSPGWVGIRQRKVHLQELIGAAIGRLRGHGAPVRIVDIAAGHGRYVLDAIASAAEATARRPTTSRCATAARRTSRPGAC